jgi:hypothetical protein
MISAGAFWLGARGAIRLGDTVLLAETVTRTYSVDWSAHPRWLVILIGTLAVAFAIWVVMKCLKWTLWLLLLAVLIGGLAWAGWELAQ